MKEKESENLAHVVEGHLLKRFQDSRRAYLVAHILFEGREGDASAALRHKERERLAQGLGEAPRGGVLRPHWPPEHAASLFRDPALTSLSMASDIMAL